MTKATFFRRSRGGTVQVEEIDLEKTQAFLVLFDMQSFSLSAHMLDTHQSMISRMIQELERSVGQKLILNSHKPCCSHVLASDYIKLRKEIFRRTNYIYGNAIFNHFHKQGLVPIRVAGAMNIRLYFIGISGIIYETFP